MWRLESDPFLTSTFANLSVLDRPVDLDRFRRRMERACVITPRLRQRVTPGDNPHWEDDPDFEIANHVRALSLGRNNSLQALYDVAALAAVTPFDPRHPAWEFVLITGLRGGRGAMIQRMHHSLADGEESLRISLQFLDTERDAADPPRLETPPPAPPAPAPSEGSNRGRLAEAVSRQILGFMADPTNTNALKSAATVARTVLAPLVDQPRSRLWAERSVRRKLEPLQAPLAPIRAVASALGGTLNTAFLTIAADAAGAYHRQLGEPVDHLRASMAISTRTEASGANAFTLARFMAPTADIGVSERFTAIGTAIAEARGQQGAASLDSLSQLAATLPTALITRMARAQAQTVDFATSNLRAASFPLYITGAKVLRNHPIGPLGGVAFNLTLMSYCGSLDMGLNVDCAAITDPPLLRRLLVDAATRFARTV